MSADIIGSAFSPDEEKLIALAKEAMKRSYAPYSGFNVGAALLCRDGSVYLGCNIENAAYSPTCCAERVAIFKAVSELKRDFSAIAIIGGKSYTPTAPAFPCGVCRQVMAEFCRPDFRIILPYENGVLVRTLSEMLPDSFTGESLG